MLTEFVLIVALVILAYVLYQSGYIPTTVPYLEKKMNKYYLSVFQARDCTDLVLAMDHVDADLVAYMSQEADTLEERYPRQPLNDHVASLRCVDDETGEPIGF